MKLHLVGLPHTEMTDDYSWCAFTALAKTFATMMSQQGFEVITYGGPNSAIEGVENVPCHEAPSSTDFFVPPWTQEYFHPMNERAIKAIRRRIEPGDLILLSMGVVQIPIANAFPEHVSVEYCVGYGGSTAPAQVYPSEAWRHIILGHRAGEKQESVMTIQGMSSHAVIPHFLDPLAFPKGDGDGDYVLFVGRLGSMKGEEVAAQAARLAGVPLKVVGAGDPPAGCEYLGTVGPKERAELMGNARAVMTPSLFPEPFCLVAIEAQMCGTPAITTDWGAFTETVEAGVSGFRCSTLNEFAAAIDTAPRLDRKAVRRRAKALYSMKAIGPQYTDFFNRLDAIYPDLMAVRGG